MTLPEGVPIENHNEHRTPHLHASLHWKFLLVFLLLVSLSLLGLFFIANAVLEKSLVAEGERRLLAQATAVRVSLQGLADPFDRPKVDALVDKTATALDTRISVIGEDGTILGDSTLSGNPLLRAPRQASPTEIAAARERGDRGFFRRGTFSGADFIRVSLPFASGSGRRGIVRVDLPLTGLETARAALRNRFLIAAGALLAALSLLLIQAARTGRRTARDLQAIGRALAGYSQGELETAISLESDDAVGELGRGLETMRHRLRKMVRRTTEERDRLQEILNTMQEGVLMLDRSGVVTQVNPALRALFDLPPSPVGRRVVELIRAAEFQELLAEGLGGGDALAREITVRRSDTDRHFLVRFVQVKRRGEPFGAVAVFHDVTETRRLEKMRSDFLANVSHELKTPLTAIRGYAETLTESPPQNPAQARTFLETILTHAKRLGTLVDDLLELSRIESGEAMLKPQPVTLAPFVARAFQGVEPIARQRKLTLASSVPDALPQLHVDPSALETILSNLVDNAVKYGAEGGQVEVRAGREEGAVRIEVADDGPGIPPEHLSRLFERFYRVDPSRSREQGGTGLGLAIVKHLAQAMGGRAHVRSAAGKGSVFSVLLPVTGSQNPSETA